MGVTQKFEIVLTNSGSVFFPGQALEGHVLLDITENMKMRGVFILCTSKSEVYWKRGKHRHRESEDYLNLKLCLFGNASHDGDDVTLSAGKHMFPFQFVLPINLPGSYEGEYGCFVRHSLKAIVDRPWKFNKEFKMVYTVASVLDLNAIPTAAGPVQQNVTDTSCYYGCCNDGGITASFRLDKTGFVPGESFCIYGEVKDGANVGIRSTSVLFVKKTIYMIPALGIEKEDKMRIGILRHEGVEPGGTDVWNGDKLRIPPIPPSYLVGCNLIDIQYYIKVQVNLGGFCGGNVSLHLPVIIGTVPLYATVQQNLAMQQNLSYEPHQGQGRLPITQQPMGNLDPSAPIMGPSTSAAGGPVELPPPTYQECVFGKRNTKDEGERYTAGNMDFAPSYTYYENMV